MNKIMYGLFCILLFSEFLAAKIHPFFVLMPEICSGLILVVVLLKGSKDRAFYVKPRYVILFIFVFLHIFGSVVTNMVAPGTVVTGLRPYFKWIPIFLLPMVYHFSNQDITRQLKFLLGLSLLQLPVSLYQRFFEFEGVKTGDVVTGTLGAGASGALSIYLLLGISVLLSFYLKQKVRTGVFILLSLMLFLPVTINETKITLILLPLALIIPFIYTSKIRLNSIRLLGLVTFSVILVVSFITIYDQMVSAWGRLGIIDFIKHERYEYLFQEHDSNGKEYLATDKKEGIVTTSPEMLHYDSFGRISNIRFVISTLADYPVYLWLGVGVGNASTSIINMFSGEYSQYIGNISGKTVLSLLLWETGIGGVILFMVFLLFIFQDTHYLTNRHVVNHLASGWMAVVVIIASSVLYTNFLYVNPLIYLFAYFSGYITSERYRLELCEMK